MKIKYFGLLLILIWISCKSDTFAAEEHIYSDWIVVKEPTCTEMGERYQECLAHGGRIIEDTLPLGHEYEERIIEPTCTEGGKRMQICIRCGDTIEEDYSEPQGHDFVPEKTREPACEEDGLMTYHCTRCDEQYTETLPGLSHIYSDWTTETLPEVGIPGRRYRECRLCKDRIHQSIPALEEEKYQLTVLDGALVSVDLGILLLFFLLIRPDIYRINWDRKYRLANRKNRQNERRS